MEEETDEEAEEDPEAEDEAELRRLEVDITICTLPSRE